MRHCCHLSLSGSARLVSPHGPWEPRVAGWCGWFVLVAGAQGNCSVFLSHTCSYGKLFGKCAVVRRWALERHSRLTGTEVPPWQEGVARLFRPCCIVGSWDTAGFSRYLWKKSCSQSVTPCVKKPDSCPAGSQMCPNEVVINCQLAIEVLLFQVLVPPHWSRMCHTSR